MARRSVHSLKAMKERGERFAMVTCYDYPSARLVEAGGFPGRPSWAIPWARQS